MLQSGPNAELRTIFAVSLSSETVSLRWRPMRVHRSELSVKPSECVVRIHQAADDGGVGLGRETRRRSRPPSE